MRLKMISAFSIITLLNACSVLSEGAIIGANKAFNNNDYLEAIRKSDRALRVYSAEYNNNEKAQLMLLKAESLAAIGKSEQAQVTYQSLNNIYPKTPAALTAKKFFITENSQAVISHYRYTATSDMAIHLAEQACLQGAKQEAIEQFGVKIKTNSQLNNYVSSATSQKKEMVIKNIQLTSNITTTANAELKLTKLQSVARQAVNKVVVYCSIKAEKLR